MSIPADNRQVVLLKSLRTNNRFYTLVTPDSGLKNAGAIEDFPPNLPLGIAYPCLEDGLNDFAVIRTTFETIDVFPDDEDLRGEMMAIIADARGNLVRRLEELRDRIISGQAHFLGTDLQEFKDHVMHLTGRGAIRRTLDNMMKVDVFDSVAKMEATGGVLEPMYRYEFLPARRDDRAADLSPRPFIGRLLDDVLEAVADDDNYKSKYTFDKHVFQKFIAVMFVNYATTDPVYYGTSREDYGVSADKDMTNTPLYQAVAAGLREIERGMGSDGAEPSLSGLDEELAQLFQEGDGGDFLESLQHAGHTVEIAFGAADRKLLEPLILLAEAARVLSATDHARSPEIRQMMVTAGRQIFRNLQELNILSPLVRDPMESVPPPEPHG